jgi:outer membrane protein TolC
MKQKYRSPYNDAQKKKLENERRRLMKEVRAANNEYATNASKLKNLNRRKRDNLKNVKIRIGRQIKSGDDLSDAEIQKAFE